MKKPLMIVIVVLALIGAGVGAGWLYFRLNPTAYESFVAEMQGEGGTTPSRSSRQTREVRRGATSASLVASGSIESEQVVLATELSGRVVEMLADEGDRVDRGDLLLRLDDAMLTAQLHVAEATVAQAQSAVDAAAVQLAMARAGARPQELQIAQSSVEAGGVAAYEAQVLGAREQRASAEAGLAAAEGTLAKAQAAKQLALAQVDLAQATLDQANIGATEEEIRIAQHSIEAAKNAAWGAQAQRDAACGHVDRGVSQADCDYAKAMAQAAGEEVAILELQLQQLLDGASDEEIAALEAQLCQAEAGVSVAEADIMAAQAGIDAAQSQLAQAGAAVESAQAVLQSAQAQQGGAQAQLDLVAAGARDEEIALLAAQLQGAEAALAAAQASLETARVQLDWTTLDSPMEGVVLERLVHEGELAVAGSPLIVLADLSQVTLTVYVPQADLGLVSLGQTVEVSVDAYDEAFEGTVTHISSEAEFTPKNVQTQAERVHMVFAVKVALVNGDLRLKPGMPADAAFR